MADVDYALSVLEVDYLDVVVLCRVPSPDLIPLEQWMAGLAAVVAAGKATHIGLSEGIRQSSRVSLFRH